MNLPNNVMTVINILDERGFQAFVVGGAVRDSILGRKIKDFDIASRANPDTILGIFRPLGFTVIPTGIAHGTVTVMVDGEPIEITTFRTDGFSSDNRHPDNVEFVDDLKDDLARRDFTINALAFNPKIGLVDFFGGIADIRSGIVRCVGDADARFSEDGLRMLRAIRFVAELGFELDDATKQGIINNSQLINNISAERIQSEFSRILASGNTDAIVALQDTGLLQHFLPEFSNCFGFEQNNPFHVFDVAEHTIVALQNLPENAPFHVRLAVLLHDIGKVSTKITGDDGISHFRTHNVVSHDLADDILHRLKFDNDTINKVLPLVLHHDDILFNESKNSVKRKLNKLGVNVLRDLLVVRLADVRAQHPDNFAERGAKINDVANILDDIITENACFSTKDLAISGDDLITIGFKQGKIIGQILSELVEFVIDNPDANSKDILIQRALQQNIDC